MRSNLFRALFSLVALSFLLELIPISSTATAQPMHAARFVPAFRPVCPIGVGGPGCFAPVRKSARFVGRVGVAAGRVAVRTVGRVGLGVGRVAVGAARVGAIGVARTTGFLFGRRFVR